MVYPRVALHIEIQGKVSLSTSQTLPKTEPNRACPCMTQVITYVSKAL